ncbi:hypothetical protein [Thalassobellus sediminis]|uniref:hypothetical protein n=1 Tax=Thalassobellus sediminis TaxID=3367753 RepID=UPI0037B7391F
MKHILLSLLLILFSLFGFTQTDGISYQAVIIDNNPQEIPGVDIPANNLPNVALSVQFSIIDNSNAVEYQELHDTTTDPYGMINLMIGQGNAIIGVFNQIYWSDEKFLKVEINLNDGNGFVEFSYQDLTYIPYVKHREIIATSTLDVDGATNLNDSFTVNNASPSLLTGDLKVEGIVSFDGGLDVGGDTQLYADLTVDGITNLNSELNVNNGRTTNLSGDLNVQGASVFQDGNFQNITVSQNSNLNTLTTSGRSNLNGQVVIDVDLDANGSDLNSGAHPLRVMGSQQGIVIELTGMSGNNPSNSNNFLSFNNANNVRYGRIEGQTQTELTSSFEYVWYSVQEGLQYAFQLAMIVVDLIGVDDADAAVVEGIEMVDIIANWAVMNTHRFNNVGVAFESGFGDYAEWLEKSDVNEVFSYGDIVGVSGGNISKNATNADHFMVISKNPIVLGNMPAKENSKNFEKVAFMGQVPVKVKGIVNIGDYIIPSGFNDGFGVAINPNALSISNYNSIVGVAWSSSSNKGVSLVNLAVGINTRDTAIMLEKQNNEINMLKKELNSIVSYLQKKDTSFEGKIFEVNKSKPFLNENISEKEASENVVIAKSNFGKSLSKSHKSKLNKVIKNLKENPDVLNQIMLDTKEYLNAKGVDYKLFDQTNKMLTDKTYFLNFLKSLSN